MVKVLITGITGFLGAHIAEHLSALDFEIIGFKREKSDLWRCEEFKEKINWIELDADGRWKERVIEIQPDIMIHCAWLGVESELRNNWTAQGNNILFFLELCELAAKINLKKMIVLGSQAEYGFIEGKVFEDSIANPTSAYGALKLSCQNICKTFCESNDINWVWLRVFSIFGEKENENWLIPSLVKQISRSKEMDFTEGVQKYAYLYVKDFVNIIAEVVVKDVKSGIYNVSGSTAIELRVLVSKIRDLIKPDFKLNFGAIPQRPNQSMHLEGSIKKLSCEIGQIEVTDFDLALKNTISYYKYHQL